MVGRCEAILWSDGYDAIGLNAPHSLWLQVLLVLDELYAAEAVKHGKKKGYPVNLHLVDTTWRNNGESHTQLDHAVQLTAITAPLS